MNHKKLAVRQGSITKKAAVPLDGDPTTFPPQSQPCKKFSLCKGKRSVNGNGKKIW